MDKDILINKDVILDDTLSTSKSILNDLKDINQENISNPKTLLKLANNALDTCTKELVNNKNVNLDNIKEAIPKDKLKEFFSKAIDQALDIAKKTNLLPNFLCNTLKVTKDYFMQNKLDKKIDKHLNSLEKSIGSVQKDINSWQKAYNCGDLEGMQKALESAKKHISKVIPIDSIKQKLNDMTYTQKYNDAQKDLQSGNKNIVEKAIETVKLCQKLGNIINK